VVTGGGAFFPARAIVQMGDKLTFTVPAIDAAFELAKSADAWTGQMTVGSKATPLTLSPGAAPDLKSRRFVTLGGGRQILLDCRGSGVPAVVFDAGAGGTTNSWRSVHDEIAKTTTACAYDRAGHGLSDPRPLPLDAAAVAEDLDAVLTTAGIPAPYVLVGHSLGSYHVRQYANTRFDKMAGMVLVDPSGDGQMARFNEVIPAAMKVLSKQADDAKAADCPGMLRETLVKHDDPLFKTCNGINDAEVFEYTQSEVDSMQGASTEQLTESHRSYGDMPLIVLTRSDYRGGAPAEITDQDLAGMKQVWVAMHDEMTALSSVGEHRTIPDSGHNIQIDQPHAVIAAVNDVVTRARARQKQ
jgi:pimeloyl-ACP methyl ester carboxylesterase